MEQTMNDALESSIEKLVTYFNEAITRLPSDLPDMNRDVSLSSLSLLIERLFTMEGRAMIRGDERFPRRTAATLRNLAGETMIILEMKLQKDEAEARAEFLKQRDEEIELSFHHFV
jgi:hypothetical protein